MSERVDAVVIGAGLGGLAAAVTLSGHGLRPVVLEQHTLPGGYATGFQRGAYRFDASLHALNGVAPGGGVDHLYQDLGIWDRLRLHRLDPLYVLRAPGREIVAHADAFEYEAELIRSFPLEADGIRRYLDEALAVYRDARRLDIDRAAGRRPTLDDFTRRYPAMVTVAAETWDQLMSRHVSDPRARTALGAYWGYVGLPPSQLAALTGAMTTTTYHQYGGWYPEGGAQALSRALVQVLRERGVEILYGQLANGFDFHGDRAVAVTTHEGLRIEAERFVSNASAPTTMLDLVGRDRLPVEYVRKIEGATPSYSTFSVYLGLDRDLFAEQGLAREMFLAPSFDADEDWQAAQRGDWSRAAMMLTDYTHVDPGCAPQGHAVVVLSTAASWDYADTWGSGGDLVDFHQNPRYRETKEQVADELVARAERVVPGLAGAIGFREASTPLTNFFYTRNPRGAIEGFENSPANTGLGWLSHKTPVPNLFLAGAWTGTGGMNGSMAAGRSAARLAARVTPVGTSAF